MSRLSSIPIIVLLVLLAVAFPHAVSADYPSGDPPETVPFGYAGEVVDYDLTIINVDFNAGDLLRTYNPSFPTTSDTAVVMIQIEATYTGDGVGHPRDDMDYSLSDIGGHHHDLLAHACPAWPFPPDDLALTPGRTGRFNLCFLIPVERMSTQWIIATDGTEITVEPGDIARLTVNTRIITDQWPVSFSLDKPESPIDPDLPDCGCVLPPTDMTG